MSEKAGVVALYAARGEVFVMIDPRVPGVELPPEFRGRKAVTVKFSHRYPTGALVIGSEYLAQRLSFRGRAFRVRIPWEAVFAAGSRSSLTEWAKRPKPARKEWVN